MHSSYEGADEHWNSIKLTILLPWAGINTLQKPPWNKGSSGVNQAYAKKIPRFPRHSDWRFPWFAGRLRQEQGGPVSLWWGTARRTLSGGSIKLTILLPWAGINTLQKPPWNKGFPSRLWAGRSKSLKKNWASRCLFEKQNRSAWQSTAMKAYHET